MPTPHERPARRRGSHFSTPDTTSAVPVQSQQEQISVPQAETGAVAPRPVSCAHAAGTHASGSNGVSSSVSARLAQRANTPGHGGRKRGGAGASSPSRARLFGLLAVAAVVVFVLGALIVRFLFAGNDGHQTITPGKEVTVTIPEGADAATVASVLFDNGVIESKSDFLSQLRRTDADHAIKSGAYLFVTGDDTGAIIARLTTGPNAASALLSVPEGLTVARLAQTVQESLGIPADEFITQAKASNYVKDYPFLQQAANDSLEGYLFPKTYDFSGRQVTADLVIRTMLSQYQTEVAGLDLAGACSRIKERFNVDINEHGLITLASIVEREAVTDEQRPHIAEVFLNRLSKGQRLESDATLAYTLGREVTADDLRKDDPYNSYMRDGLTPTPICSPGLASIQAVCNPSNTGDMFFFIQNDYAVFSKTYEEHQRAIAARPQ